MIEQRVSLLVEWKHEHLRMKDVTVSNRPGLFSVRTEPWALMSDSCTILAALLRALRRCRRSSDFVACVQ